VHFLCLSHYTDLYDTVLVTFLQVIGTAIISGITALIFEPLPRQIDAHLIFALVFCALFATAIGFYILSYVQKILSPAQTAILVTSESIFGAFFGWLILRESFSFRQYLGAAMLLFCMLISNLLPDKKED
ncbi:MAG: DMT family transporter, partial [Clostridiales bacterium]